MDAIETEKFATTAEMFEIVGAEIEQLRLVNSDLQMYYDYAKTECDKLQSEVLRLRGSLQFIAMAKPLDGQTWEKHSKQIKDYAIKELEWKEKE